MDIFKIYQATKTVHPFQWDRVLGRNQEFMNIVNTKTKTNAYLDLPLDARIYAAVTETSPICAKGKIREFGDTLYGWVFCGGAVDCECYYESKFLTKEENLEKQKLIEAAEERYITDSIEFGRLDELQNLIDTVAPKSLSRIVERSKGIYAWLNDLTKNLLLYKMMSISEKIFIAVNGIDKSICINGQQKTFNSLQRGYRFCANNCKCRIDTQSAKITQYHLKVKKEENNG